jgi:hypothetical protein
MTFEIVQIAVIASKLPIAMVNSQETPGGGHLLTIAIG